MDKNQFTGKPNASRPKFGTDGSVDMLPANRSSPQSIPNGRYIPPHFRSRAKMVLPRTFEIPKPVSWNDNTMKDLRMKFAWLERKNWEFPLVEIFRRFINGNHFSEGKFSDEFEKLLDPEEGVMKETLEFFHMFLGSHYKGVYKSRELAHFAAKAHDVWSRLVTSEFWQKPGAIHFAVRFDTLLASQSYKQIIEKNLPKFVEYFGLHLMQFGLHVPRELFLEYIRLMNFGGKYIARQKFLDTLCERRSKHLGTGYHDKNLEDWIFYGTALRDEKKNFIYSELDRINIIIDYCKLKRNRDEKQKKIPWLTIKSFAQWFCPHWQHPDKEKFFRLNEHETIKFDDYLKRSAILEGIRHCKIILASDQKCESESATHEVPRDNSSVANQIWRYYTKKGKSRRFDQLLRLVPASELTLFPTEYSALTETENNFTIREEIADYMYPVFAGMRDATERKKLRETMQLPFFRDEALQLLKWMEPVSCVERPQQKITLTGKKGKTREKTAAEIKLHNKETLIQKEQIRNLAARRKFMKRFSQLPVFVRAYLTNLNFKNVGNYRKSYMSELETKTRKEIRKETRGIGEQRWKRKRKIITLLQNLTDIFNKTLSIYVKNELKKQDATPRPRSVSPQRLLPRDIENEIRVRQRTPPKKKAKQAKEDRKLTRIRKKEKKARGEIFPTLSENPVTRSKEITIAIKGAKKMILIWKNKLKKIATEIQPECEKKLSTKISKLEKKIADKQKVLVYLGEEQKKLAAVLELQPEETSKKTTLKHSIRIRNELSSDPKIQKIQIKLLPKIYDLCISQWETSLAKMPPKKAEIMQEAIRAMKKRRNRALNS